MTLITLAALAYLVSPVLLICGWAKWVRQPKLKTLSSTLSLVGFVLATASALLAIGAIAFAQVHHFPHWDPLLIRIYRAGFRLSVGGIIIGMLGIWRPSSLRWYGPTSGVSTLAFWMLAATSE